MRKKVWKIQENREYEQVFEGRDNTNGLKKYVIRLVTQNNTLQ